MLGKECRDAPAFPGAVRMSRASCNVEDFMNELQRTLLYSVLPLRDIVVFPHMIVPLFVGRAKSVRALEDVMKDDKQVLLATQKNATQEDPQADDIYTV